MKDKLTEPIIVSETFNKPIHEVWAAITEWKHMTKWYFSNIPAFEAKVGFETQFPVQSAERTFTHIWKVIEVIVNEKIAYEWTFEEYPGSSISHFELTRTNNLTELKLICTTEKNFPDHIPEFKRESGVEGWTYLINKNLKEYLEM